MGEEYLNLPEQKPTSPHLSLRPCAGCGLTQQPTSQAQLEKANFFPFKAYCQQCVFDWCMGTTKAEPRDPARSNFKIIEKATKTWQTRSPFNQPCYAFADKGWCPQGDRCFKQHGPFDSRCSSRFVYDHVFLSVQHAREDIWYI